MGNRKKVLVQKLSEDRDRETLFANGKRLHAKWKIGHEGERALNPKKRKAGLSTSRDKSHCKVIDRNEGEEGNLPKGKGKSQNKECVERVRRRSTKFPRILPRGTS